MTRMLIYTIVSLLLFYSCTEGSSNLSTSDAGGGSESSVQSGSYANMLAIGDRLYIISQSELITMDISDPSAATEIFREPLSFDLESMFIDGDRLFVGSQTNLYIYTLDNNGVPVQSSVTPYFEFDNICPFDPVVAQGDIAYVTLSSDITAVIDNCGRFVDINELRLYDISDISNPYIVSTTPMINPKGLGQDGDLLFVCEKNHGLKVLDVSNPEQVVVLNEDLGFNPKDIIVLKSDKRLLVVGPEELRQYYYNEEGLLNHLSNISLLP